MNQTDMEMYRYPGPAGPPNPSREICTCQSIAGGRRATAPNTMTPRDSITMQNTAAAQNTMTPQNSAVSQNAAIPQNHMVQNAMASPIAAPSENGSAPQNTAVRQETAYQAATPYPPVRVACPNPRYAAAMLDNLGGQNSEISAVALYFYDQLLTSAYTEIAETFHHISIVEMHHLEIFGTLAMQLGENPRLWSRKNRGGYVYWSPGCLRYPPFSVEGPTPAPLPASVQPACPEDPSRPVPCPPNLSRSGASLRRLLSQAIESEQAALNKYLHQTSWIQDQSICDNLRRIAADEQMHIDILTRLYYKY